MNSGRVEKFTTNLDYTNPHISTSIHLKEDLKVGENDIEKIADIKGPVFGASLKEKVEAAGVSGSEAKQVQ